MKHKPWAQWLGGVALLAAIATAAAFFQYSLHRSAEAAAGDVILLWDGPSSTIPAGWNCISCSGGAFQDVFPQAAPGYGASVVDSDTVTHTLSFSSAAAGAAISGGSNGSGVSGAAHTHAWPAPAVTAESIVPPYRSLLFISANNPAQVPAGAIAMFDVSSSSLPAGWTYYSPLENLYLRGGATVATGGSATSTAYTTAAATSGAAQGSQFGSGNGKDKSVAAGTAHTHSIPAGSPLPVQQNAPSYITVVFAKANADTPAMAGMLAFFDAAPPAGWSVLSSAGSAWDGRLIKGGATFGAVGGSATENNGGTITWTSGPATGTNVGVKSGNNNLAATTHTHAVTYAIDTLSALPAHRAVLVAKRVSTAIAQSHYRWRNDDGGERSPAVTVDSTAGTGSASSIATAASSTLFASYICTGYGNCFRGQGMHLAKSTDGGASWTTSFVFDELGEFNQTAIAAPSASTIDILANNSVVGTPMPGVTFFRSTDGGANWASTTVSNQSASMSNASLAAPNSSTAYAAFGLNGALEFAKSTDGGATWATTAIDQGSFSSPRPTIAAPNASTIFIAYSQQDPSTGGSTLLAWRSADGGATWASSTVAQGSSWPSMVATSPSTVLLAYYSSATQALMSSRSTDGGATWTTSTMDPTASGFGGISNMTAADASQISIAYMDNSLHSFLLRSTNGGAAWSSSPIATFGQSVSDMSLAPAGLLYNPGMLMFLPTGASGSQATFAAAEDTPLANVAAGATFRLRLEASDTNGSLPVQLRIEYATSTSGPWVQVGSSGAAWAMKDSQYITDGEPTADISGGLTDVGSAFVPGELHDATPQTGSIFLNAGSFTEVEYAITPTAGAVPGQAYYFRATNAGSPLDSYPVYGAATLAP